MRRKLIIQEYCVTPYYRIRLVYNGPNPQLSYKEVKKLIKECFGVNDDDIQEKDFQWTRGPVERFSVEWVVTKDLDKFTFWYIQISLKGEAKPSKEFGKVGSVTVVIGGFVRTEYPQDTWWQRSVFYEVFRILWDNLFYVNKRLEYQRACKAAMFLFHDRLKEFFNLLPQRG